MSKGLPLAAGTAVRFAYGGHLMSRGRGRHVTRTIDSHELIVMDGGALGMVVGERQVELRSGDFLHIPPGVRHGGTRDYDSDTRFYWLHFHHRGPSHPVAYLPGSGRLVRREPVVDLIRRLLDTQDRPDTPMGVCDLLMHLVLLECTRSEALAPEVDPNGLAERARSFIVLHHAEAIGAREVAEHCGCHPDHLGRCFKARFRVTLTDAIHNERMLRAKALLRDDDRAIAAIAAACGYRDAHYFHRRFRRTVGMGPGSWRRLHQRQRVNTE